MKTQTLKFKKGMEASLDNLDTFIQCLPTNSDGIFTKDCIISIKTL